MYWSDFTTASNHERRIHYLVGFGSETDIERSNMALTETSPVKGKSDGNKIASQLFAEIFHLYLECSDGIQSVIRDMVQIVNDPSATRDEIDAALDTIAECLFPSHMNGMPGADLEECETFAPPAIKALLAEMDRQEATFSERVNALLKAKEMTQLDLARAIGVGQPAVSMMLSRDCRPQFRTVVKVAEVLGVAPEEIWPEIKREG